MRSKRKSQFLGHVFEGAFKLGFLKEKIKDNEYKNFKERGVFNYILVEYKDVLGAEESTGINLIQTWNALEEKVPDGLESIKELGLKYTEENLLYFIFLVGYHEGLCFGKEFKNINKLIKYEIGEESNEAGNYRNADLIFIHNKTLYVIDLKLGGAQHRVKYVLDGANDLYVPFRPPGVPVNLSLAKVKIVEFLKEIPALKDKILTLQNVNPEIKGFLQTLSYAVDYLSEEGDPKNISEVNISLFYPLAEPFSARFYWKGENVSRYKDIVKEMYEFIKSKEWKYYNEVGSKAATRHKRLWEQIPNEIEEIKNKMKEMEAASYEIKVDSVENTRKDVKKRLKDFLKIDDDVKALCLLHSAGSGKTTQIREAILKNGGYNVVLYAATRKVILDREKRILPNLPDLKIVYEQNKKRNWNEDKNSVKNKTKNEAKNELENKVENKGDGFDEVGAAAGIIKQTVKKITELTASDCKTIWAFFTQQAIVENERGGSTSTYLGSLVSGRIAKKYHFHVILDEFLGHNNGLFAVNEMFKFLNWIKEKGGKANLYLLDANGYSPPMLKKLLEEYAEFEVVPDAVMICDHKNFDVFERNGIKVFVYAKHGYPSPKIILKKKFILEKDSKKSEESINKSIIDYVKKTFKEDNTAFIYLQNKKMLSNVKLKLNEEGFSTLVATADSRQSQEKIKKGNEDVILSTSALSRGIDLSRPEKPVNQIYVIINNWGIENNLVELIQTISRARGDEKTEKSPKEIHLIYSFTISDNTAEAILEYLDVDTDKDLVKLLLEKHSLEQMLELDYVVSRIIEQFVKNPKEEKVLVPIPKQYKTRYIPNPVGEFEEILSFVKNVYDLTGEVKLFALYTVLIELLTVSIVNVNFKNNSYSYYHPYILFEKQQVNIVSEDSLRQRIYELLNSEVAKDNESEEENNENKEEDDENEEKNNERKKTIKDLLREHNKEKAMLLENFVHNFVPKTSKNMPVLIPVYSYVLTKHFLRSEEKVCFYVNRTIGRGGANSMMGIENPKTRCYKGNISETEYACIPLGESYPYKEVLSGRFVKFPIEFLSILLRKNP